MTNIKEKFSKRVALASMKNTKHNATCTVHASIQYQPKKRWRFRSVATGLNGVPFRSVSASHRFTIARVRNYCGRVLPTLQKLFVARSLLEQNRRFHSATCIETVATTAAFDILKFSWRISTAGASHLWRSTIAADHAGLYEALNSCHFDYNSSASLL